MVDLAILGGVLLIVAIAIAWDHWRSVRRLRLARLLDDPRYGEAVEILWERRETAGAFCDALEHLVAHGIDREEGGRNLTRMLGFDSETARHALGRHQPTQPARTLPNPWDRKPTPASSSAFILPGTAFSRGAEQPSLLVGPRS